VVVEMNHDVLPEKVKMAFKSQFDAKELKLDLSADGFAKFLKSRTAVILHYPQGMELCRSSGNIVSKDEGASKQKEKIVYEVRTRKGSSGSPVLVTYEFEENNWPIIVGVHSRGPTGNSNHWNYGFCLLPFLSNVHEYIAEKKELHEKTIMLKQQNE
jgi:Cft2 family RNA processing exonuclease